MDTFCLIIKWSEIRKCTYFFQIRLIESALAVSRLHAGSKPPQGQYKPGNNKSNGTLTARKMYQLNRYEKIRKHQEIQKEKLYLSQR